MERFFQIRQFTGSLFATAALTAFTGSTQAEPSVHYASACATRPVYLTYTRAYSEPVATVTYSRAPAYAYVRPTYAPSVREERVIETVRVVNGASVRR